MRIAVTSDLHFGLSRRGDAATQALAAKVAELRPDLFAITGDVGEGEQWPRCLAVFGGLDCRRVVLPGNHDIWTRSPDPASLSLYADWLPRAAAELGFHYLDSAPLLWPASEEAVVGSINWYDYSFADPSVEEEFPGARELYEAKRFPNARHNDGVYVRLGMTDAEFTEQVVHRFQAQLAELPETVRRVIVLQHHPPVRELFYPSALETLEQRFWLAYTGNRRMEAVVKSDARVTTVFCGHTHAACSVDVDGRQYRNIGGDYHFKRLLYLDTDTGEEQAWDFEDR